ncbi:hypothetical protein ACZ87_02373 [Candidatus Erwinia dacicola]|uniref:Uncharacterized protein n=1 Tax=Candidatus Erwinia dacicola TaxID=252393 RepID=A0A328TP31_9GAMM|nr:hypothetical protein ACZ87_02373 [Candidatus Erwinia dacicola]
MASVYHRQIFVTVPGRLRFAGAMVGVHATKMLSDRLHRMAKKRWLQVPALDKFA